MIRFFALLLLTAACTCAQSLTNASLTGKYFAHWIMREMADGATITDQRSISGVMQFDGAGGYAFNGTRKVGGGGAEAFTSSGTYTMNSLGVLSISNMQGLGAAINARYAPLAIFGSSTEAGTGIFDLFAAVPAPTGLILPNFLEGAYRAAGLEFTSASTPVSRAIFFGITIGSLSFGSPDLSGVASNVTGLQQQVIPGSPFSLNTEGRGQTTLPGVLGLYFGPKTIYASRDGKLMLIVPEAAGTHGLAVAIRTMTGVSNETYTGLYWSAGLRQNGSRPGSFVGTVNSIGNGISVLSRRDRELEGVTHFTGRADYQFIGTGTGTHGTARIAIGAAGDAFVASEASADDLNNYGLFAGVRTPPVTVAPGPFLNPFQAVNSASLAPVTNPAAPGQYLNLSGSALATSSVTAAAPFPDRMGGVQVLINDRPAPLWVVSPTLLKIVIPQATEVGTATVVAVVNGTRSNTIPLLIARTAPGVFSLRETGVGFGSILRQDNAIISSTFPARRGETIQVFLNGLGELAPAVPDGRAAPETPLTRVTGTVRAYIRGVPAEVTFAGLAPGWVSLNQVNVVVPASIPGGTWPLAIETDEGFTDQVDVAIQQ